MQSPFSFLNALPIFMRGLSPKPAGSDELGILGEKLAGKFLKKSGYKIIQRNYRCPLGEIDLIASQEDRLIFVEVKTRRSTAFGGPVAALGRKKQLKIIRSAQFYLKQKKLTEVCYRFDLVAILWEANRKPRLEHIENAFSV